MMSRTKSDTRVRILSETLRLMEERRGLGVRIEDVAQAAGVTRQAVYLHFPSRTGLLIETTHYLDEVLGIEARLAPFKAAKSGIGQLCTYVDFWGNYLPQIYGLAKALLVAQDTDPAAAAAWSDRMDAVRNGCCCVITQLELEHTLAPGWNARDAEDMMCSLLSIAVWENLTRACGWPNDKYVHWMQQSLKRLLIGD